MTSESSLSSGLHRFTMSYNEPSDIGQRPSISRWILPDRHVHITHKIRIAGHRVLLTVQDDPNPGQVFLRIKGPDATAETVAIYDVVARLLSVSLQYGVFPLEKMADLLSRAKFA